ncbi:tetratricopeptide repeat protein [Bacteroidota bacterium]
MSLNKSAFAFMGIIAFSITLTFSNSKIDSLKSELETKKGVQQIEILLELSSEYLNVNKDESIKLAHEALKLSKQNELKSFEARATYDLGYAYYLNNNYTQAIIYLENAITLRQKFEDKQGQAMALNRLGNTYQLKGDYEKALELYDEALNINQEIDDKKELARTLTNLGSIYRIYGIFTKAVDFDLQALKYYEEVGYKEGMAWLFLNIARLYKEMEEYDKALTNADKSFEIYKNVEKESGNKTGVTLCLNEFASIYYKSGNLDKALEYQQKVLKINEEEVNKHAIANSIAEIGKIYYEKKDFSMALAFLNQSVDLKKEINDNSGLASIFRYIGNTYLELDYLVKAEIFMQKGIEKAEEQKLRTDLKECYESLSKLYTKKGDYENAFKYQNLYTNLKDSLNIKSITKLEMQYEFDKKQQQNEFERKQKEAMHQAELHRQKILKNSFIVGFILMIALAFFIFKNYREKKKSNIELRAKNEEILQQKEEIMAQRDEIEKQKNVAEQQRDQIQHQNKVITDSIQYAKRIQTAVLPKPDLLKSYFDDYFIYYKPRDIVSGDFYWFTEIQDNLIVVAADCTGHGVPGAFMSMMGIAYLNEIANKNEILEANKILELLRDNVIKSQHHTGEYGETKDGMDMALIILNKKKKEIQYAGANNPLLLLRNNEVQEFKPDRMPIGIFFQRDQDKFANQKIKLKKDDVIYLFSDGYADQFSEKSGMKFLFKRFRNMILELHQIPMEEQEKEFDKRFIEWKGKRNQIDDVLVMGLKV